MSATSGKSFKQIDTLTGTTLTYGFEALSTDDIVVVGINTTPDPDVRTTLVKDTHYTLNTTTKTVTSVGGTWAALSADYNLIRAYRVTTAAALVDFKSGGVLSESDLDTAYKQSLFVAQEVSEDAAGTGASGLQSVGEAALEAGAVTEGKIGANAVTSTKIADNAVITAKIIDDAVTAPKIADNAVITATILNDAVTIDKIADDAVGLAQVADNAVGTAQIVNDAVTYDKVDTATQAEMEGSSSAGVCVPDILKHHPGVAKCCGVVTYDGSTPTVLGDYNVASVSEPTGTQRRITFTNAMANANYVVHLTEDHWGDDRQPYLVTRATTYFDLDDSEGEASGRKIHFTVFGTLA
jgi:hypothetical protein